METIHKVIIGMGATSGLVGLSKLLADRRASAAAAIDLANASEKWGYPRPWFPSIALWEGRGRIRPSAVNMKGPDATRGGAWGAMQITEKTVRDAGFTGDMHELLVPSTNGDWAGRILSKGHIPRTLEEMASLWNSGHLPANAPDITITEYIPGVQAMLDKATAMV
jgi:soluble lytic murein transglycosylase-like protein